MGKAWKVPFDREARQGPKGVFLWVCGGHTWQWTRGMGMNLARSQGDGTYVPLCHADSLREAAFFAEGYTLGEQDAEVIEVSGE